MAARELEGGEKGRGATTLSLQDNRRKRREKLLSPKWWKHGGAEAGSCVELIMTSGSRLELFLGKNKG